MLRETSSHYNDEVEYPVGGPLMIYLILSISLAPVVGFFPLAILLPMWDTKKLICQKWNVNSCGFEISMSA
jgi:hypothetical protein